MSADDTGLARLDGPVWLDVTRLLTRVGRGALSGIDRVEMAYLRHLARDSPQARYLCRTTRGYLLLSGDGALRLAAMATGAAEPGAADLLSVLTGRGTRWRHRAEASLRPLAVDRCRPGRLAAMLRRQGPPARYLTTGHANLTDQTLAAFGRAATVVLIHDLIPVLHPDLVPPDQPARFAEKLERVRRRAGLVIANSRDTAAALARYWAATPGDGGAPPVVAVPLGIEPPTGPARRRDPKAMAVLGTIEPRKNLDILLQAWDLLAATLPDAGMPHLHVIGAPGWQSAPILARIAARAAGSAHVTWHGPLGDAEAGRVLSGCSALLHPSLAEGFGLPPREALALGLRSICADLPVLREGLGAHSVYVDPRDPYAWAETIGQHLAGTLPPPKDGFRAATWHDHLEAVAGAILADPSGGRQGRQAGAGQKG